MRSIRPSPACRKPGASFFLPFLYGSNAGLEMTCGFYGMQALHTRAHLLQAVYEGVVFSHMTHLNRMRERFTDVQALRVTGGPAHSDVWMQMLADVSGLRVELPQVEETGCFGARSPRASAPAYTAALAMPSAPFSTRYARCCPI
jgi:sugar (pentulose or hexulose) kinase